MRLDGVVALAHRSVVAEPWYESGTVWTIVGIVDPDLHANAMRAMSGRQRRVAGRGRRLVNLFAGLARCEACGSKMIFRGKGLKKRADGSERDESKQAQHVPSLATTPPHPRRRGGWMPQPRHPPAR